MNRCAVCHIHCDAALCLGCQTLLPAIEFPCQMCAKPLSQSGGLCGECRTDPPPFSHTIAATTYQEPATHWVQQLKFGGRLDWARIMADALARRMRVQATNQPIIPIPLHQRRLRKRGYNQSNEIARLLARRLGVDLWGGVLERQKDTAMQAELPEKQRSENVRNAFVVNPTKAAWVVGQSVWLLDDVMTSGQTLRSAAQCLLTAGAANVQVVVFARSGH